VPAKPAQTEVNRQEREAAGSGPEVPWTKDWKKAAPADVTGGPGETGADDPGIGRGVYRCFVLHALAPGRQRSREPSAYDVRAGSPCPEHGRIPIGASDLQHAAYSYDDGAADPELKRSASTTTAITFCPTLRAAAHRESDLFLFLAVESSRMDEVQQPMLAETSGRKNIPT